MTRIREQRPLVRYLHAIVEAIIADPTFSRNDAVQFLRDRTVGIDQAEAIAYYDQLAVTYIAVGVLAGAPTYNNWRDGIVAQGEAKSKALVNHIHRELGNHAIMDNVNNALRKQHRDDSLTELDDEIVHLEGIQVANPSDQTLIDALEFSLEAMRSRRDVEASRARNARARP